jgi:RNA polymerase sigma-70 factor (ECF subfamily)
MLGSTRELADVMVRVGRQDREAFEQLYAATHRKIYGIILGILRDRSRADETLQEVYVRVWQKAADFDPQRSSPITWLAVIARNRALDEIRRRATMEMEDVADHAELAAPADDPLAGRERSERFKAVIACLNRLEAERRDLVLLAYYRGLSREALAQRFDRPVATIKTWLHRSLTQLKTCLAS